MKRRRWIGVPAALALVGAVGLTALARGQGDDFVAVRAGDLEWVEFELPGLEPGVQFTRVHGDPGAAGELYVIRVRFPDGYRVPLHVHPNAESVTILEGRILLGMGLDEDAELEAFEAGDFIHIGAADPHHVRVEGDTVIQVHGVGPFELILFTAPQPAAQEHEGEEEGR
ncbi:MAG: cupin domain-containing protein [Planctomycetes bacterium]|nr:cupin domain-containing protein [Planctomycetota bacterium]